MCGIIPETKKPKILIVDDEEKNCKLLEALLKAEGYGSRSASNGAEALRVVGECNPDLILLDVMMPGIDGFQVAERLKDNPETRPIPIIMVTALNDRESRIRGLDAGAEEFLTKPIDRLDLTIRVRNLLRLKEFSDFLRDHSRIIEIEIKKRTKELKDAFIEAIHNLMQAAEYKDEETGAHVRRISFYTKTLAMKLGLGRWFVDAIFYTSPMHDVGKIGIPDNILLKPGSFTKEEWEIMKTHTTIGAKILGKGLSPYMEMSREIALAHHERWDGSGYPRGLEGEEIPLSGRVMMICDQYDALRNKRPYKPGFSHGKTINIITKGDGHTVPGHFDPAVLDAFLVCENDFEEIYESCLD